MTHRAMLAAAVASALAATAPAAPKRKPRPYRLKGVSLRQPVIWGS